MAQYDICCRVLDEELGLDPDEETQALHRQILDGSLAGAPPLPVLTMRPVIRVPAPLTPLIGRAAELVQIGAFLADPTCRLLTLVGMGGVGKTRLALEVAQKLVPGSQRGELFPQGVVFVELALVEALGTADATPEAFAPLATHIADALHLLLTSADPAQLQLARYLREKALLLVLDNCEHLPVAAFVLDLLHQAPQLTVVATSRSRLNLRGEQVIELEGLALPVSQAVGARTDWSRYSALQLFRQIAQTVNPRQRWTASEIAAATDVCALVNGLPLGIELAASLTRLMSCADIAREIADNLAVLHSTSSDLPARHQSLQAVFDHSWNLLGTAEQQVLRQLSVFHGSFDRAAARHVAGASVALLTRLLDTSLMQRIGTSLDGGRYTLLDLVRRAAAVQLEQAGDAQRATLERHARYYLALLAQSAPDLRRSDQQQALDALHQERENIRVAWRWAVDHQHTELLQQTADGLFLLCEMRSRFEEGRFLFAQAAQSAHSVYAAAPTATHAAVLGKLLARQGWLAVQVGQQAEGRALLVQSLELLRAAQATAELAFPLNYLAAATYYTGDYAAAQQLVEEALAVSQACGDMYAFAIAKTILGQIAYLVGRYDDARRHSLHSLEVERALGNQWGTVFTLISLGRVAQAQGQHAEAQRYFQDGLHIRVTMHDTRGVALCLQDLGDTAQALGDHDEARWCYQESLALFTEIGSESGAAAAQIKLGSNALARHDRSSARKHFLSALRTTWDMQILPATLAALAGLAATLVPTDPDQAYTIAALVWNHPATGQISRDQASAVLAHLPDTAPAVLPSLETILAQLLQLFSA